MRKSRIAYPLLLLTILVILTHKGFAQDSSSLFNKILSFPDKVFNRIDKNANAFEQKINNQTEKYLTKLQKQEEKLKRKLWKQDSVKAKEVFGDIKARYDELRNSLKNKESAAQQQTGTYIGHIDSLTTALSFIHHNPLVQQGSEAATKINSNLQSIKNLKNSFNQTEIIRKQIKERQQYLKTQLQNTGLVKEFRKFRKEVYYYQQQAREYKDALNDPEKLGEKLLETAMKVPAFQNFFRQNSELASLFRLPGGSADPATMQASFAGLQTRASVQQQMLERFGTQAFATPAGGGASPFQQQIQAAQTEMQKLKNKASNFGGNGDYLEMPDFKTNDQKTKSFLKRIEWGTNMQTSKGTYYFPVTSDIGLSAGYKLNDKSIIGIGASYKIGFGKSWDNIHFSNQGAGLRTFIDWKAPFGNSKSNLLKSLWISGGAEMNYRNEFRRIDVLKNFSAWQQSALLGIIKKYSIGKKWKGNAQILYDFLWRGQRPQTQPIVFRVGYNFK